MSLNMDTKAKQASTKGIIKLKENLWGTFSFKLTMFFIILTES